MKQLVTLFAILLCQSIVVYCQQAYQQYQAAPVQSPIVQAVQQQQQKLECPLFEVQHSVSPLTDGSNEWKIQFHGLTNLDIGLVDIHWKIIRASGAEEVEMNERMTKLSAQLFERNQLTNTLVAIKLNVGDCIQYWFTYCLFVGSVRVDCDTAKFRRCIQQPAPSPLLQPTPQPIQQPYQQSYQQKQPTTLPVMSTSVFVPSPLVQQTYQQPASSPIFQSSSYTSLSAPLKRQEKEQQLLECPLFEVQHSLLPLTDGSNEWKIQFHGLTNLDIGLVDIHWKIIRANGAEEVEMNERMTKLSAQLFERNQLTNTLVAIKLNVGDCIQYWFTYCLFVGSVRVDCDTAKFRRCIQQPTPAPTPSPLVQPIPQPIQQPYQQSYQQPTAPISQPLSTYQQTAKSISVPTQSQSYQQYSATAMPAPLPNGTPGTATGTAPFDSGNGNQ